MERDSFRLLERLGMGLLYTLTLRDGKQGTLNVLTLTPLGCTVSGCDIPDIFYFALF